MTDSAHPFSVDAQATPSNHAVVHVTSNAAAEKMSFSIDMDGNSLSKKTVTPVDLVWKNLGYSVVVKKNEPPKQILKNISGLARAGHLCAVMGSSGAGKSSLLDLLARRMKGYTGTMEVNNSHLDDDSFRRVSGYVTQQDMLMETLTVRETIEFYAALKLSKSITSEAKNRKVKRLIHLLGLEKAEDTLVGGTFVRGVSGGERRRVSIGVELITEPSLLFLDEPTSGLDSYTSLSIVHLLKTLAKEGHTIIATIHQPRPDIFVLFDSLLLLSEGETVFFGPSVQATNFFKSIGYTCPAVMNPADFVVDIITPGTALLDGVPTTTLDDIRTMRNKFSESAEQHQLIKDIATPSQHPPINENIVKAWEGERIGTLGEIVQLIRRNFLNTRRNPIEVKARISSMVAQALLVGFIFFGLDMDQSGARGRLGTVLFCCTGITFATVGAVIQVFPLERNLILHERRSNAYSLHSYMLSRFVSDRPLLIVLPLLYSIVLYFLVNLRSGGEYFALFLLEIFMSFNNAQALGMFIGAISPNVAVGSIFGPLVSVIFLLFSGFFVAIKDIPVALRWLNNISMIRWAFESLAVNEFEGVSFTCDPHELVLREEGHRECPLQSGEQLLAQYEFADGDFWFPFYMQIVIFVVINILTYLSLLIQDLRRRK
eukprot:TRINITY_DN444_c0_g1_i6.p1 TRINITY_DN444_c0_g1~~TRINITY_DN444_c0_g1_i6.p1  ORF type:complete len:657 (-),score=128.48 TRINITY_DN444_c0_g1_i6:104-2074(-)